jgi:nucleotidyltransferase/DNA polymerase involved in DNA repair
MIACLNVPYFAATVERRDGVRHDGVRRDGAISAADGDGPVKASGKPGQAPGLVLGGQPWEPQPVYAFSHEAAQQGVKAGMSLRLAHVLSPEAQFMAANPPRYTDASAEVADVLLDFTHLIEIEALWTPSLARSKGAKPAGGRARTEAHSELGAARHWRLPAVYTLDLESLPQAEALGLAQEMGRQVRHQTRLAPAVGLANSKFVAQVAAALAQPNHARPVAAEEEGAFLTRQPIQFLPLDKETARRLSLLGIRTLGQLAALPQSSIRLLLGAAITPGSSAGEGFGQLYRLVQAQSGRRDLGDDLFLAVKAQLQEKREQLSYRFDGPVADKQVLEQVIDQAATELAGRLQRAGLEGRTLQLILETEGGRAKQPGPGAEALTAELSRRTPTADPRRLAGSLHELLGRLCSGADFPEAAEHSAAGIVGLTIRLDNLTPAAAIQLSLFDKPRVSERLREALANILAKHQRGCFFRTALADPHHPLPERRFQLHELSPA